MGDVQKELGLSTASSFVIQVKNPSAPATGPQPVRGKGAEYPNWLMQSIFGSRAPGEGGPARGARKVRTTLCFVRGGRVVRLLENTVADDCGETW